MNQYENDDRRNDDASFGDQAERFSRKLSDSAQQVWLAGLGALGRAQAEGSRFFDSLVKEGEAFESRRREKSTEDGPGWRDNVEEQLGQAREKASGTWDKVEKAFEDRVHGVLKRLHVPNAEDVSTLNAMHAKMHRMLEVRMTTGQPLGMCGCGYVNHERSSHVLAQ